MQSEHNIKYDLEERTMNFSMSIITLCNKAPKNVATRQIIFQLIKSATSIGANYREANGGSSKKDFRNKIFICKKESKETEYWLELLGHSAPELLTESNKLRSQVHEFILIFSKIATHS